MSNTQEQEKSVKAFVVRVSWDKYLPDYAFFTVLNIEAANSSDAELEAKEEFLRIHPTIDIKDPLSTYVINKYQYE